MPKRFMASLIAAAFLLAAWSPPSSAQEPLSWSGRVVLIIDGDSLLVRRAGRRVKVRLDEVDCPEPDQPFGKEAKSLTSRLCLGKKVQVENAVVDPYYKQRYRATVILPDGRDLGMELVKEGLAWNYRRFSKNPLLPDLERDARSLRLGLWSRPKPTPPWQWRKENRSAKKNPSGGG